MVESKAARPLGDEGREERKKSRKHQGEEGDRVSIHNHSSFKALERERYQEAEATRRKGDSCLLPARHPWQ